MCARGVFEQLKAALQLPAECMRKGRALGGGICPLFASGERHLLPSFFHLLRHMHAQVRSMLEAPGSIRAGWALAALAHQSQNAAEALGAYTFG